MRKLARPVRSTQMARKSFERRRRDVVVSTRVSSERALVARHRLASHGVCTHARTTNTHTHHHLTYAKKQRKERANTKRMEKKRVEDEDGPLDGRDQRRMRSCRFAYYCSNTDNFKKNLAMPRSSRAKRARLASQLPDGNKSAVTTHSSHSSKEDGRVGPRAFVRPSRQPRATQGGI